MTPSKPQQPLVGFRVPPAYSVALAAWAAEVGVTPSELGKAALELLAVSAAPNSAAAATLLAESRRIPRRLMWAHALPSQPEA